MAERHSKKKKKIGKVISEHKKRKEGKIEQWHRVRKFPWLL